MVRQKAQQLYKDGIKQAEIARRLGVSKQRIHQIVKNYSSKKKIKKFKKMKKMKSLNVFKKCMSLLSLFLIRCLYKVTQSKDKDKEFLKFYLFCRAKNNQILRPISLKNIFKQTGINSGSRERYRELVRIRDKHTCQLCYKKWIKKQRRFDIHHIVGNHELTRKCDKNFDNQITMCHKCHLCVDAWKMNGKKLK